MKEYRICMPLTVEEVGEVYLDVLHPALSADCLYSVPKLVASKK